MKRRSAIKYFRENYESHLGQTTDDVEDELDKLRSKMLLDFDNWRNGKNIKLLSVIPKYVVSPDVNQYSYVNLTVLFDYESSQ